MISPKRLMSLLALGLGGLFALVSTACGDSSDDMTGPTPPAYDNVAGSYSGTITGTTPTGATPPASITGTLTLSLTQLDDALGGTYAYTGTVTDGPTPGPFFAAGTVSGTIQPGPNPTISALFTVPCTNGSYSSGFGVTFASATRNISLTFGSIVKMSADCQTTLLSLDMLTGTLSPQ